MNKLPDMRGKSIQEVRRMLNSFTQKLNEDAVARAMSTREIKKKGETVMEVVVEDHEIEYYREDDVDNKDSEMMIDELIHGNEE